MAWVHDQLSDRFYKWELRGRGWQVFDKPVSPEPPFRPFLGHYLPEIPQAIDDGRRPTLLSSFVQKLSRRLSTEPPEASPSIKTEDEELEPELLSRDQLVELQTSLPANLDLSREAFEQLLLNLSFCREPIAFELLGFRNQIITQFAACPTDALSLRRQLQAYFPEALFQPQGDTLDQVWNSCEGDASLVVDFGLEREFMLPLAVGKLDPFIGLIGALSELQTGELGLFQVLFQSVKHGWAESITRSVTHEDGKPFFVNARELVGAAEKKISRPLYAAVVRIAVRSQAYYRTLQIARDLAGSMRVFINPQGNSLIPLHNDEYPPDEHCLDVIRRQSRRTGMLLNSDELIGFVHLPSSAVRSARFKRETAKTKKAPSIVRQSAGVLVGENVHAGESIQVRVTPEQRVRHTHIIGASGTGKSTLIFNLIREDIENGEGVALLDPHGDLVDRLLSIIPANRVNDVVLVDPSDEEYSVGFNILSAHSELEKNLLASDLVSVFERLSTSWGDQMGSVLNNAILAFLDSSRRGTLADLRRFLIEPAFRADFLKSVEDPDLLYYWQKGFPQLSGNKSIGSVMTRLGTFLAPKPIRYMVSQTENRLDFGQIMDSGKIFLAKLSQGLLGKENSYLLGTLLVSKFQQLAMARQSQQAASRKDFWLYIDEFHNFITPSMAEILAGARKYRIGLVLAHQDLRQLQRDSEVASAVLSNPYTRICFRVGDDDARKLSDGFSFFEARDLQNLSTGQAVMRAERSDYDFNISVSLPAEPDENQAAQRRQEVITASRATYAIPRAQVEAMLRALTELQLPRDTVVLTPKVTPAPLHPTTPSPPPTPVPTPPTGLTTIQAEPGTVSERKVTPATSDLGRGGAQHQAIQQRIKQASEALGFRGVIEKQILEGQGSVDLVLERPGEIFACEISITTTIDHEIGNIAKCLKAGFHRVVVICVEDERLRKIAAAVAGCFDAEFAARVQYFNPDQFISLLHTSSPPVATAPHLPETRRGYEIKRSVTRLTAEEEKQREEAAIRSIAETMRRKR